MAAIIVSTDASACVESSSAPLFMGLRRYAPRNKEMVPKRALSLTQTVALKLEFVNVIEPFRRFR